MDGYSSSTNMAWGRLNVPQFKILNIFESTDGLMDILGNT